MVQGAGSVEPYRYTLAAAQSGEKLGVEMALRRVTGLLTKGDRCCGVTFEGGQRSADAVVLAMGPWTEEASSWCHTPIPVVPLKGQILRLQLAGEPLRTSLHWAGSYASSKPDGLVWAVARWSAHCGERARRAKSLFGHRCGPQGHSLEHRHEPRSGRYDTSRNQRSPRPDLSGSWSVPERLMQDGLLAMGR